LTTGEPVAEAKKMLPLGGVRVADFTHMLAGPYCTTLLGDLGADVVKVEAPGRGDGLRHTDRVYPGDDGAYFLGVNRNKRSIELDLKSEEGLALAWQLVERSNIVVENFSPGTLEGLGLGYDQVHDRFPHVVYCSISAFGNRGPLRDKPGVDLVIQALSGVMGLTGEPGGAPVRLAPSLADYGGALYGCIGVLAALHEATATGVGAHVEVSLLDGQISLLSNYWPNYFATGQPDEPVGSAHPQLVPYQLFPAKDGYLVIACLTNGFWRRLCTALDLTELGDDERFRTNPDRLAHRDEVVMAITRRLAQLRVEDAMTLLDAHGVPNGRINLLGDVAAMEQTTAMESFWEIDHPVAGNIRVAGNPVQFCGAPLSSRRPAPMLGEHTNEVRRELEGLSGFGGADAVCERDVSETSSIQGNPRDEESQ
jgi:formyl-CoA transferase